MTAIDRLVLTGLAVAGLGFAVPSAAQDRAAPSAKPDDIIVTGVKDQDRDRQISDFVRAMTVAPGTDPLARFDTRQLCPQAFGLGADYNKAVTDRMRSVAAAAKISLAREGCRNPNAVVIFANDKAVMIALLRKRYPWLFVDARDQKIDVPNEPGPAAMWHIKGTVSSDGAPIISSGGEIPVLRTIAPASRIQAAARPVYLMSVLVIERRALDGLTVKQVADYAAMRSYSDADPARARENGATSILTVLDAPMGSEVPLSITAWDLSFVRGLYAASANSRASAQRGTISDYMKRELDKGGAAKK